MSERAPGSRFERRQFSKLIPSDTVGATRANPMDAERFLEEVVNHLRQVGDATLREIHDAVDIGPLRTPAGLRNILRDKGPAVGIVVRKSIERRADLTKQNVYGLVEIEPKDEREVAESGDSHPL